MKIKSILCITLFLIMVIGANMAKAGEMAFGYCDDKITSSIGPTNNAYGRCAIYIPAEISEKYKGMKLVGLKCGLYSNATEMGAYVSKTVKANYEVEKVVGDCPEGWQTVRFDNPYVIDGTPFYAGYYGRGIFFMGYGTVKNDDGAWQCFGMGADLTHPYTDTEAMSIRLIIDTGDLEYIDVSLSNLVVPEVQVDTPFKVDFTTGNSGTSAINNLDVEYKIGDDAPVVKTLAVSIEQGTSCGSSLEIPDGYSKTGKNIPLTLKVLKVNGTEIPDGPSVSGTFNSYKVLANRTLVIEEKTATWCMNCPTGIIGGEYMDEKYPDTFIMIAVHCQDQYEIPDYKAYINNGDGLPAARANRIHYGVPVSSSGFESQMDNIKGSKAVARMEVEAESDNLESEYIRAKAKAIFVDAKENINYKIGFILLENKVFSRQYDPYHILPGAGKDSKYTYLDLNHIARKVYGYDGIDGSVQTSVGEAEEVDFEQELAWSLDVLNRNNAELVALLFDASTGEILNAAKTPIKFIESSAVENIASDKIEIRYENGKFVAEDATIQVFSVSGVMVPNSNLERGVYIVKAIGENGSTVQKFVVKE